MTRLCTCAGNSASKLELSREENQLTQESCKTCGGILLVNGIGPVSTNMLSTVGTELKIFINPDLSWKTLTKGRRSRQPAGRRSINVGEKLINHSPKRVSESSVSESEELGVAVLRQRFSDKLEHIPIKKRRHLLRSRSPPPRTRSQHHEKSLSRQAQTPSHSEDSERLFPNDDFSGIALLASAAYISSIGGEAGNGKEDFVAKESSTSHDFDSSTCTSPLKETITLTGMGNYFQKDLVDKDNVDDSLAQDNSVAVVQILQNHDNQNDRGVVSSVSSKDDRLHWDLYTAMDACDYSVVDVQRNVSCVGDDGIQREKLQKVEDVETQMDSDIIKHSLLQSTMSRMISADLHEEYVNLDLKGTATGHYSKSNTKEHFSKACFDHDITCIEEISVCTSNGLALEPLTYKSDDTKASSYVMGTDASLDNKNDGVVMSSSVPFKDDRLHWDLNTVMDAWNKPCDYSFVDFQRNVAGVGDNGIMRETREKIKGGEMQRYSEIIKQSAVQSTMCRTVSGNLREENVILNPKGTATGSHLPEVCSDFDITCMEENSICTSNGCALEPLNNNSDDTKASSHISSMCGSEEKMDAASASISVMHNIEDHCKPSASRFGEITVSEIGFVDVSVSEKPDYDCIIGSKDNEDFGKSSGLPDTRTSPTEVISTITCKMVDNSICISDTVNHSHPSPECEDLSGSGTSVVGEREGELSVPKEPMPNYHPSGFISKEPCRSYSDQITGHSGEIALPFDDCHDRDVPHGRLVGAENITDSQVGYDSPFEDGELRESGLYSWEEETECVYYDSDNIEADDYDESEESHCPVSEKTEVGCEVSQVMERGTSLVTKVMKADFHKSETVQTSNMQLSHFPRIVDSKEREMVGKEGVNAGSSITFEQSANTVLEVNDSGTRKSYSSDKMDGLGVKGQEVRRGESRASRGKLFSRGLATNVLDRNHGRSHNLGGSYSQAERDFHHVKSMGKDRSLHVRERNYGNGHRVDSSVDYWGSRSRHPASYRDSYTVLRNVIADSTEHVGGLNDRGHKKILSYSSRDMYRSPIRRRSAVDREDYYVHKGMPPVRCTSGVRSRDKPGNYWQGVNRGPREGYYDNVPDDGTASSFRNPHYSAWRDTNFSPSFSRGDDISRSSRKSRLRSRTRSPPERNLQSERNLGTKRYNRSPDFRFNFQKPRFTTDYEENLLSPPRGRIFARHDYKWIDDQNCFDDHSRDGRSPVRNFRHSQRVHSGNNSGRLKSDSYIRSTMRTEGFPRGRRKYEDNSDGTRNDDRRSIINRVKRYDIGGVRQFHYDAEVCVKVRDSHDNYKVDSSNTDRRDIYIPNLKSVREEKTLFKV